MHNEIMTIFELLTQIRFFPQYLKEDLSPFVSDGTSLMFSHKSGLMKQLVHNFPNTTAWHCTCHRLESGVGSAVYEDA
jgi:hypothetical protein